MAIDPRREAYPARDKQHGQVGILYPHHEVHSGSVFDVSYLVPHGSLLADDANIDIVLTVGTKELHMVIGVAAGGDADMLLYAGPNFTANGTVLPPRNMKMNSPKATTVTVVRLNPTVNAAGTLQWSTFVPGGSHPRTGGGTVRSGTERILAPSTSYLLRLTNRAGSAQQFSLDLEWYEESV